jgi:urea transport system permease protein
VFASLAHVDQRLHGSVVFLTPSDGQPKLGRSHLYLDSVRLFIALGTMQNPEMASTLGTDPVRVYAATFVVGAALTGLAGGLLAPISGVIPHMGAAYVARAFVTVISGGSALIAGTVSAVGLIGTVESAFSLIATPVIGQAALLIAAIVLLRVMPQGISGRWQGVRS